MTDTERKALSAYVLLSMDMEGYIDSLSDMASDVKELLACPFCGRPTGKKITECGMSERMSHFWCRGGNYNTRTPDPLAAAVIEAIIGDFEFIKKQGQGTEYLVFTESTIKLIAQYQKAKG